MSLAPPTGSGTTLLDPRTWRGADFLVFASGADAPRARRPTDVILLLGALATVLLLTLSARGPGVVDDAVAAAVAALPMLAGWFWEGAFALLALWSVVLLLCGGVSRDRRMLLWEQLSAVGLAFGAAAGAGLASGSSWSNLVQSFVGSRADGTYPAMRLAVATAIIVTTSPYLSRPLRHAGRWVVAVGASGGLALGITELAGTLAGLAVGVGSAALVHLVFGSPGGRLPLVKVRAALADLDVDATDLRHATFAPRGVHLVTGSTTDGRPLLVKVYGRDAWDGQLISSFWLSLWYRDTTPSTRLNRLQQVEHEAFATLLAERAGVPVLPFVAAGLASGRDALLVVEADGRPFTEVGDTIEDDTLRRLWDALGNLHGAGVAHGRLTPDRLVLLPDGTPALADFGAAVVAARDSQLCADRAQLLVTTALLAGPDRAVAVAHAAIGADELADVLPMLQLPAIEPSLRREVREQHWGLAELRRLVAATAHAEIPELEKLRRVSIGSFIQAALVLAVVYVVLSAIAGIGWGTIVDELRLADLWWVLAAILIAPVVQIGQAFSTMGASERPVRFGPVLALQYAIGFLALAVPSSAARVALAVRFFQKAGATTTAAAAVGLIDSLSGFVIQALVVVTVGLTGVVSLSASSSGDASFNGTTLAIIGVAFVVAAVVALSIPRVRGFIRSRAADSKVALQVLHSRRNLLELFGGNLAAQSLLAVVLGLSLLAFGEHATFADLLLVNTLVALFAGLMPVPGGIGVTEAALTAGLAAIGIPSSAALSTALLYRVATYYLPPAYGAPAMSWLRRSSYI